MAESTTATKPRRRVFGGSGRSGSAGYWFVLPSLLFIFVFVILPILASAYYSLADYDLMKAPRFAGLKNYRNLFGDPRYPNAIANTIYFAVATVPSGVVTSLLLAALINRRIRAIYAFRAGGEFVRVGGADLAVVLRAAVWPVQ